MNIHEYQAKALLKDYGVAVLPGQVAYTADEAEAAARALGGPTWVVKAQIHAGGRGKGGGVKLAPSLEEVRQHQQSVRDRLGASERTYLNFLEGAERRKGAPTSIDPADLAEIAALRRQLDPGDLLRFGVEHT